MGKVFFFSSMIAKVNFKTKGVIKLFPKWFLAAKTRMCYLRGSSPSKDRRITLEKDQKWHNGQNSYLAHGWHFVSKEDSDS